LKKWKMNHAIPRKKGEKNMKSYSPRAI